MEMVTIGVKGMTCSGCVAAVERVLKDVEGVQGVEVTLEPGQAVVRYDSGRVDADTLRAAIEDAGYDAV